MQATEPTAKDASPRRTEDPPVRGDPPCVEAVMTVDVWACAPHDTLDHAARLMWERDCGVLPVIDRDRRVLAMITDRDICMAAYTKGLPLCRVRVSDAMSRRVHGVHPTDTLLHAEHLMCEYQVRRLPVADATGRLVGLLSLVDLALHVHPVGPHVFAGSADERIARTLAAIGVPHGGRAR